MKTWSAEKKAKYLEMAEFRLENDLFEQGQWLNNDKEKDGVFCGCMHGSLTSLDENVLSESSKSMGWPIWLTHLSEKIFEGLDKKEAPRFVVELIKAVPAERDINFLIPKIEINRMESLIELHPDLLEVLNGVIGVWSDWPNIDESAAWSAAKSASWSAELAARSASWSAELAARSASWSAKSAAKSASWSAAKSASWSAARSAARSASWSAAKSASWSAELAARSASWSAKSAAYRKEADFLIKSLNAIKEA